MRHPKTCVHQMSAARQRKRKRKFLKRNSIFLLQFLTWLLHCSETNILFLKPIQNQNSFYNKMPDLWKTLLCFFSPQFMHPNRKCVKRLFWWNVICLLNFLKLNRMTRFAVDKYFPWSAWKQMVLLTFASLLWTKFNGSDQSGSG